MYPKSILIASFGNKKHSRRFACVCLCAVRVGAGKENVETVRGSEEKGEEMKKEEKARTRRG